MCSTYTEFNVETVNLEAHNILCAESVQVMFCINQWQLREKQCLVSLFLNPIVFSSAHVNRDSKCTH